MVGNTIGQSSARFPNVLVAAFSAGYQVNDVIGGTGEAGVYREVLAVNRTSECS